MKKIPILANLTGLLIMTFLVIQGCKKDEKINNLLPTCKISYPAPAQTITKGETITIKVEATDADGTISEVQFYVDNVKVSTMVGSPYNYNWDTGNESIGDHILKATCVDNDGGSASDEITVVVIDGPIIFTDPRDGHKYKIVDIGSQTWFAENLNFETSDSWWYDNSEQNGEIYGRLYTWDTAQTVCPDGWRLPNDDEWKVLEVQLGMSLTVADEELWRGTNEGDKMKSISGWNNSGNGTNSSGFNGLPGGFYSLNSFSSIGEVGGWWSSTEKSNTVAWERGLDSNKSQIFRFDPPKTFGLSVRCIKN